MQEHIKHDNLYRIALIDLHNTRTHKCYVCGIYHSFIACTHCNLNGTMDEICDMVSGSCLCRSGVTGTGCTECFPGSFGAPGLLIDCKPCPCVNIDNPLCHLNDDGITATCDNCGPAYSGQYCELCANGYYRDEMV